MVQPSIQHLHEPQPEPTIQPFIARGREDSFAEACLPEHYLYVMRSPQASLAETNHSHLPINKVPFHAS